MLEAKQATATRPLRPAITSVRPLRTVASEPELPSTNTLVESQIMARTPESPSARNAASSATSPSSGSGSSFQSPVCTRRPNGVSMASALGSGIEWVTVT